MIPVLYYVTADDWAGIYKDGKLYYEGHSVPDWVYHDLLKLGPFEVDREYHDHPHSYRVAERYGGLPETWDEFLKVED